MLKATAFALLIILAMPFTGLAAAKKKTLVEGGIAVVFDESARATANEVAREYPALKTELEDTFKWKGGFEGGVTAILLSDKEFRKTAGRTPIVAYAIGSENTVVVGLGRAEKDADTFRSILKHELAHIYLAHRVGEENLPRWLNEGVCQWVSGGISEMLAIGRTTELERATLLGNLLPLDALSQSFPGDDRGLKLAYQESLSFVEFIVDKYGQDALLKVLDDLGKGEGVSEAFKDATGSSLPELEAAWHKRLSVRHTLLTFLSNNIYTILFALAGLITVYGFIRLLMRMRAYREEDDDEGPWPPPRG